jgi:3',5'-cyclic AMP phosphodiesterase CpdA
MSDQSSGVRLAHLSDVHVTVRRVGWRREDWLNKRLAAWFNLRVLGRGFRFRSANLVLEAMLEEFRTRRQDHIVFSGDATAMGFEEEMAEAARLLRVGELPGIAVPGNHDYCTRSAMLGGSFERHFAPWQVGERVGEERYPFAQRVGHVWLIAVNSATANRWAWDARGSVGPAQLERLRLLLDRIEGGPRILVTHYPVARASGRREPRVRELRDLDALLEAAKAGGVGLWLHGHRHDWYFHPNEALAPFPVICAGSATQTGLWSYGEYVIAGSRFIARQRVYDGETNRFCDGGTFELDLPSPGAAAQVIPGVSPDQSKD